jgi:dihydropyrimidinase
MALRIYGHAYCDVAVHVTPTRFDAAGWRAIEEVLACGIRTIKLYTTYRNAGICSSYDELDAIFRMLHGRLVRVLVHCEDDLLLEAAAAEVTDWSHPSAHAQARPPVAEVAAIHAVLERAAAHAIPLHIVHVSTPEGADLIAAARRSQVVTCETGPQYFALDATWLDRADGHRWICSPALRPPALVKQMAGRARDGAFDVFASDHCPFLCEDKDAGCEDARTVANGIPGIGALPHLSFAALQGGGGDPLLKLGVMLSENPARVMGLYPRKGSLEPGADADIIIVSPDDDPVQLRSSLAETYEPYPGFLTRLRMHSVLVHGVPVVHDGFLLDTDHPQGSCTWES